MKFEIWHMLQEYLKYYERKPRTIVMGNSQYARLIKELETLKRRSIVGELKTLYGVNVRVNKELFGIFLTPFGKDA